MAPGAVSYFLFGTSMFVSSNGMVSSIIIINKADFV